MIVDQEITGAPVRVRELMAETFTTADMLPMTTEALELTGHYMAQKVVPVDYTDDARHVAVCSVARLDYLVSWNFKPLANVRREAGFNAVNVLHGYPPVRIVAPTFLIHGHDQEKTFDAVASSRRWRLATSKLLNRMTPEEQIEFLNRRLTGQPGVVPTKAKREPAHR